MRQFIYLDGRMIVPVDDIKFIENQYDAVGKFEYSKIFLRRDGEDESVRTKTNCYDILKKLREYK